MIQSIVKVCRGIFRIKGDSDGTLIGNTGDELNVRANFHPNAEDAFSRFRVSEPRILFSGYYVETDKAEIFTRNLVGTATASRNSTDASYELSVSASGDSALNQSKEYIHYVPGVSYLSYQTVVMAADQTNLVQDIGTFDDNNGLFFRKSGSTLSVVVRSNTSGSVVNTVINQSSWNGDKLDGTGPSGITLDTTKDNIYVIDQQWLGSGTVRFGFNIGRKTIYVHTIDNANQNNQSYMRTGSLPVRQKIEAIEAITGTPTLKSFCCSVQAEGDIDFGVQRFSASRNGTLLAIDATAFKPLVSVRLKAANIRATLIPLTASALASSNKEVQFDVYVNATLTGPSWTSVNANSVAEFDVTATAITGGKKIESFATNGTGSTQIDIGQVFDRIAATYSGTSDIITIAARSFQSSGNAWGSISWKELF